MYGGYAEYVKVLFRNVLPIPENMTLEAAQELMTSRKVFGKIVLLC